MLVESSRILYSPANDQGHDTSISPNDGSNSSTKTENTEYTVDPLEESTNNFNELVAQGWQIVLWHEVRFVAQNGELPSYHCVVRNGTDFNSFVINHMPANADHLKINGWSKKSLLVAQAELPIIHLALGRNSDYERVLDFIADPTEPQPIDRLAFYSDENETKTIVSCLDFLHSLAFTLMSPTTSDSDIFSSTFPLISEGHLNALVYFDSQVLTIRNNVQEKIVQAQQHMFYRMVKIIRSIVLHDNFLLHSKELKSKHPILFASDEQFYNSDLPPRPEVKKSSPFRNSPWRVFLSTVVSDLISRFSSENKAADDSKPVPTNIDRLITIANDVIAQMAHRNSPEKQPVVTSSPVESKEKDKRVTQIELSRRMLDQEITWYELRNIQANSVVVNVKEAQGFNNSITVKFKVSITCNRGYWELEEDLKSHSGFDPKKSTTATAGELFFNQLPSEEWLREQKIDRLEVDRVEVTFSVRKLDKPHMLVLEDLLAKNVVIHGKDMTGVQLSYKEDTQNLETHQLKELAVSGRKIDNLIHRGGLIKSSRLRVQASVRRLFVQQMELLDLTGGVNTVTLRGVDLAKIDQIFSFLDADKGQLQTFFKGQHSEISAQTLRNCFGRLRVLSRASHQITAFNNRPRSENLKIDYQNVY